MLEIQAWEVFRVDRLNPFVDDVFFSVLPCDGWCRSVAGGVVREEKLESMDFDSIMERTQASLPEPSGISCLS